MNDRELCYEMMGLNSWMVSKRLAKDIGNANYALLYAELLERSNGSAEWFTFTQAELMEATFLSQKTIFNATERLVELGFVERKRGGWPNKCWYKIRQV